MVKERRKAPDSSRTRVCPYPLRSRNKKQKETESRAESKSGESEWSDVRCVICMEPPHNATLLQCSSYSKGCRAYMCDTSASHSNCLKQYRRTSKNGRTFECPYCRGEVNGTIQSTSARRFMNAKPRCCSVDKCEFSGTYNQLKTHMKTEHPGYTPPKLDPSKQKIMEQLEREEAYFAIMNAQQRWIEEERLVRIPDSHIDLNFVEYFNMFRGATSPTNSENLPVSLPMTP